MPGLDQGAHRTDDASAVVVFVALRVVQWRLEASGETEWWLHPPWNPRKTRPSVLDLERLFRRWRGEIQALLACWLEKVGKVVC